ncbi:MAG: sulfatase-like hydrolase/transferase [Bacteroidaceae bacterium]|nr:sulfatase-like hydrolase/transferase [Bacteroidaceae bacterium]
MKSTVRYMVSLFLLLMAVFAIGKGVFVWYNHSIETVNPGGMAGIWLHGLLLDMRTTAILLLIPALVIALMKKGLRWVLAPYFAVLGIAVGAIIVADMVMYEFWEFKLCAVHLSYAASPEGTTNSVSVGFLVSRALLILGFVLAVAVPAIGLTPERMEGNRRHWPFIILAILAIAPIHVSSCYHRGPLFMSHAATNPVYRFFASFGDAQRYATVDGGLPAVATDKTGAAITDTLLTTERPNVLFVMMESFGGKFVKELGGLPDVAPNLSRLIPEGIFWDQYYSNSFRTDRGTVCAYSGWTSYPTVSPMKEVGMHDRLSSLPRSFRHAGYQTGYMYAGAMTNMGKQRYLLDMEFESLMDDTYFTQEELNSSWGANDSTSAMKMFHTIAEIRPDAQWMMVWQTISSHEPWDVPYHRLEDKRLNAFAYTDQCVGDLIDSLRTLPVWDRLLVIVIPDHGFLYQQTYDDPEFFHSPMLWLGGAVKEPRTMHTLMNQSDIAATLLAQMGLGHDDFPWSRNVLSPDYEPFVYCTYPAGLLYKDATGETLYDLTAMQPVPVGEPADSLRLGKALQILKHSYQDLK